MRGDATHREGEGSADTTTWVNLENMKRNERRQPPKITGNVRLGSGLIPLAASWSCGGYKSTTWWLQTEQRTEKKVGPLELLHRGSMWGTDVPATPGTRTDYRTYGPRAERNADPVPKGIKNFKAATAEPSKQAWGAMRVPPRCQPVTPTWTHRNTCVQLLMMGTVLSRLFHRNLVLTQGAWTPLHVREAR